MPKYVMLAQGAAKPERDDEFNEWYDNVHLSELLALPGMKSARRFEFVEAMFGPGGKPHLAIYEIEIDGLDRLLAEMQRRAANNQGGTDSLEPGSGSLWFYRQRG